MAGVYTWLDRNNLPGRVTRLLRWSEERGAGREPGCSEWSEKRDAGWARLDRVEGGDSRRTGPSRTTIQDVPLEVGHASVRTDNGNGTIPQRFVILSFIGLRRIECALISGPRYDDYISYICPLLRQA